jgi:phospholipase C
MDGFIRAQRLGQTLACPTVKEPSCAEPDVMGWHDAREIPNYWSYARNFVLQDHMFEPTTSWSLPAHLFMMSAWSATCRTKADPESCSSEIENPPGGAGAS